MAFSHLAQSVTKSPGSIVYPEPRTGIPQKRPRDQVQFAHDQYDDRPRRDRRVKAVIRQQVRTKDRRSRSPHRLDKTFHRERSPPRSPGTIPSPGNHAYEDHWSQDGQDGDEDTHDRSSRAERRPSVDGSRRSSRRDDNGERSPRSSPRRERSRFSSKDQHSAFHQSSSGISPLRVQSARGQDMNVFQRQRHSSFDPKGIRDSSPSPGLDQSHRREPRVTPGLENAPSGPRSILPRVLSAHNDDTLPDAGHEVLESPHAYISSSVLPSNLKIRADLDGFMKRYRPSGIHVDQFGYYITFKNDATGPERLRACIREKQNSRLYDHYVLTLTPFPTGQRQSRKTLIKELREGARQEVQIMSDQPTDMANRNAPVALASTPQTGSQDAQDEVLSGATASPVSRSKSTCHVCNESSSSVRPTEISCATCPRRYHRMCAINPPRWPDETMWQCNRCVKKQIKVTVPKCGTGLRPGDLAHVERIPGSSALSPGPSVETFEAPALGSPPSRKAPFMNQARDQQAPTADAALGPVSGVDGTTVGVTSELSSTKRAPALSLPVTDKHHDEADALVRRSFAGQSHSSRPNTDVAQKSRWPVLANRKVIEPLESSDFSRTHSDLASARPEAAQPQPREGSVSGSSNIHDQQLGERDLATSSVAATYPGAETGRVSNGGQKTYGPARTAVNSAPSDLLSQEPVAPSASSTGVSRIDNALPEIPESPIEPRMAYHDPPSDLATEKNRYRAPVKPATRMARESKFQGRNCSNCGAIVPAKSSVSRFVCLNCRNGAQTQQPAPVARSKPHDFWADIENPPGSDQEQVERPDVRKPEIVGKHLVEKRDGEAFTNTAKVADGTESTAALGESPDTSAIHSRISTASPALNRDRRGARTTPSQQARRGRRKRNTYPYYRMIGMALCDRGSLQVQGIAAWILEHIPGMYGAAESSSMVQRIAATVSANLDLKGKRLFEDRLWLPGDSADFGTDNWVELQSDKVEEHERWDPVLQKPVSPLQLGKKRPIKANVAAAKSRIEPSPSPVSSGSIDQHNDGHISRPVLNRAIGESASARTDEDFSDGEPLSKVRSSPNRTVLAPVATMSGPRDVDNMVFDKVPRPARETSVPRSPASRPESSPGVLQSPRRPSQLSNAMASPSTNTMGNDTDGTQYGAAYKAGAAAGGQSLVLRSKHKPMGLQVTAEQANGKFVEQIFALDSKLAKHTVGSLYDEWPEYAPENHVDKRAVMAEIKKRPTKKQMFGKPACYSRLAGSIRQAELPASSVETRTNKQSSREAMGWQIPHDGKENVMEFDSLEEFLCLPKNPLAILVDGKLAYRDGTRNEDGELPRARTIYKTGL